MKKGVVMKIGLAALAVYAYLSFIYLLNLATASENASFSAFSILLAPVLLWALKLFYRNILSIENRNYRIKRIIFVAATGFLLGLTFVLGYQMRMIGMTSLGFKGKLFILVVSIGLSLAFSPFVNVFFMLIDSALKSNEKKENADSKQGNFPPGRVFFISWAVVFICWIPGLLAFYPAIMSYDFNRQCWEAVRGFAYFNSYQPLIHTFLIWVFLKLGEGIKNYQLGMAIFSLLQMLILSAVFSYSCAMIARLIPKKVPVMIAVLLFALLPIHPILAISMTKDILFSAFFLLFLLLMLERRFAKISKKPVLAFVFMDIGLVACGILCILFRNNAIYAIAVFSIFYIIWSKKERVIIALLCITIILSGHYCGEGIRTALTARKGSNVEMCSVIIQTVARAAKFHASSLEPDISDMCNYIVDEEYWERYNPPISDTVKIMVAQTTYPVWEKEPARMLQYWFKIGLTYPNDYIDACLALTSGYWFLDDVSHAEVLGYGDESEHGLLYTFNVSYNDDFEGVESYSFLPFVQRFYKHVVNGNDYFKLPVVSNLFKPAFYCWILILSVIALLYMKKWNKLVVCMLPFWYLMTLFLGPVVLMRYAYPIVVAAPLLLAWIFSKKEWTDEEQTER